MGYCNVKFDLKDVAPKTVDIPDDSCKPMLIAKRGTDKQHVIICYPGGALFFENMNGCITYCDDVRWLKERYYFVRYLSTEETVTFTGTK